MSDMDDLQDDQAISARTARDVLARMTTVGHVANQFLAWQANKMLHPFTCGGGGGPCPGRPLILAPEHEPDALRLQCLGCGRVQVIARGDNLWDMLASRCKPRTAAITSITDVRGQSGLSAIGPTWSDDGVTIRNGSTLLTYDELLKAYAESVPRLAKKCDALQAEVARLTNDKARLDWLDVHCSSRKRHGLFPAWCITADASDCDSVREAIDRAREK